MATLRLEAPPNFKLAAAAEFYAGFAPMGGAAAADAGKLSLAFRLDGSFEPVGVHLSQRTGELSVDVQGTQNFAAVEKQLRRMLGLDADAKAWAALGKRDPHVGKLQAEFPGFFTAAFPSAYEAAVGGVISQRIPIRQAAVLRKQLSAEHGDEVNGLCVLPSPLQLLKAKSSAGLPQQKMDRLHGIAKAALDGRLDVETLRAMPVDAALDALEQLEGVGPWTAAHILMRGCALTDAVPTAEPRVLRGVELALGLKKTPTVEEFEKIAEAWKPFRMWVSILVARYLGKKGQWAPVAGETRGARRVRPATR